VIGLPARYNGVVPVNEMIDLGRLKSQATRRRFGEWKASLGTAWSVVEATATTGAVRAATAAAPAVTSAAEGDWQ
jgi:hypothetical protein